MIKQPKYISILPHHFTRKDPLRSISNPKPINRSPIRPRLNKSIILPTDPIPIPKSHKLSPLLVSLQSQSPKSISSFIKTPKNPTLKRLDQLLFSPEKPVNGKICFKKASRRRDWLIKARNSINKDFSKCINESNGIFMSPDESCYKFYLGKRNNSGLVKQVLGNRWWWMCVDEDELPNVNLVWTQSTNLEFLGTIGMTRYKPERPVFNSQKNLKCEVLYETETMEKLSVDLSALNFELITQSPSYLTFKDLKQHSPAFYRTHNKLEMNQILTDKKFLCKVMKNYYEAIGKDVGCYVPLTYHIENVSSEAFEEFKEYHQRCVIADQSCLWIVKPGEDSNRGNGIFVSGDIHEIYETVKSEPKHSFIVQKYIERPFLINKRKFDIRLYALVTSVNGVLQCYFYKEGYLRTSSKEFTTKNLANKLIHLTNDAIQKFADDYGKFENGNKLSYSDFQRYLDGHNVKVRFVEDILPEIKSIVKDSIKASFLKLDYKRRSHSFEILGYDFLLDSDLKPWLIEVNTNPCLELSSSILVRIIPSMLENAVKIALDPVFPEPLHVPKRVQGGFVQESLVENKFELIFHEYVDGKEFLECLENENKLESFMNN